MYIQDPKTINRYANNMKRVKDARVDPAKMVFMHCVTGEKEKEDLIEDTLEMCKTMWDAVEIRKDKKLPKEAAEQGLSSEELMRHDYGDEHYDP